MGCNPPEGPWLRAGRDREFDRWCVAGPEFPDAAEFRARQAPMRPTLTIGPNGRGTRSRFAMRPDGPDASEAASAGTRDHVCPICGEPGAKRRFVAREMVHGTREPFDCLRCGKCGTLYLADPPADLGPYYENYYSTNRIAESAAPATGLKDRLKRGMRKSLARAAMRFLSPRPGFLDRPDGFPTGRNFRALRRSVEGRALRLMLGDLAWSLEFRSLWGAGLKTDSAILDVGCGNGNLVEALDRLGFAKAIGCDPYLRREATFAGGARLLRRDLAEMEGGWDLIMLHHCFEHVPNPARTAGEIDARLVPGGRCLLRFPNVESVEFAKYGGNWWGIHAPRHFQMLSRRALELVFAGTGLRVEKVWCDSVPEHYFYSKEYSLDIPDRDPRSVRVRGIPSENWPQDRVNEVARQVDGWNDRLIGDWIVYVLRKRA
jgi:SAM-dependent methyltransferase